MEPTTAELIETLGDDVARCHKTLVDAIDEGEIDADGSVDADYEFHARMLIRSIFAYIEGVTFSLKVKAAEQCLKNGVDITDGERWFAIELDFVLANNGDVKTRPAHIRTADNVRFAFRLQEKAQGLSTKFDPSAGWWSDFQAAIKVRDRLVHPKMPGDLNVNGDEICQVLAAYNGYHSQLNVYLSGEQEKANDA